jgi:hypothetical protein
LPAPLLPAPLLLRCLAPRSKQQGLADACAAACPPFAAEAHPRALLQGVPQPLLEGPGLLAPQGQLLAKLLKELASSGGPGGGGGGGQLWEWLWQVLCGAGAVWSEAHVALAAALLEARRPVSGPMLGALLQALAAALGAGGGELRGSVGFAKLCMALATQQGGAMSEAQLNELAGVVSGTSTFLAKAATGRIHKLLAARAE